MPSNGHNRKRDAHIVMTKKLVNHHRVESRGDMSSPLKDGDRPNRALLQHRQQIKKGNEWNFI